MLYSKRSYAKLKINLNSGLAIVHVHSSTKLCLGQVVTIVLGQVVATVYNARAAHTDDSANEMSADNDRSN